MSKTAAPRPTIKLTIAHGCEESYASRVRVSDGELVTLEISAVGHYKRPMCPICLTEWPSVIAHLDQTFDCTHCGRMYLVLAFAAGEKGVVYYSFPWAE